MRSFRLATKGKLTVCQNEYYFPLHLVLFKLPVIYVSADVLALLLVICVILSMGLGQTIGPLPLPWRVFSGATLTKKRQAHDCMIPFCALLRSDRV